MKKMFVKDIRSGDRIDDVFVLSEKTMGLKKDGNNFLNIAVTDRTGKIKGVVWDNVTDTASLVQAGDFVHVRGHVSEYRDALQLVVKKMAPVNADSVDPSDFLPATGRNVDQMFQKLVALTDAMEEEHLKSLLGAFWDDEDFVRQFKTAPAAKKMHHAYIGGLLEHTLSVALLAEKIAGHYSGIDTDLLLTGAILHDIGKVREFEYSRRLDYSDEGRLLSHIVIGIQMIEEKISMAGNFPGDLALLLKHLVVSHHGSREFGSPEVPKTIEAVLLNYIDEIDSKVTGIRNFMAAEDPNEPWTGYHRLLGRHFFKKSFSATRNP